MGGRENWRKTPGDGFAVPTAGDGAADGAAGVGAGGPALVDSTGAGGRPAQSPISMFSFNLGTLANWCGAGTTFGGGY